MDATTAIGLATLALTVALALFGWWLKHGLASQAERDLRMLRDVELPALRKKLDDCEAQHRQTRTDYEFVRGELREVRGHLEQSRTRVEELHAERLDMLLRVIERRDGKLA